MDQAYAVQYRQLYQRHWWWRSREEEILRQLDRVLHRKLGNSILDVGCGDGLFFDELQKYGSVIGVEADPQTLTHESPWREKIHCQRFDKQFQPAQKFDAILMLDILEHMSDTPAALAHARTLLADRGVLIATVPSFMSLWTAHDDLNQHVIRYTQKTFCPLVQQAGFQLLQSRYLFYWTCPIKLAIRLKEMIFGANPAPPGVPSDWINRACLSLTRIEQTVLSRLPMPFGSSLMVIARGR